MKTIRKKSAKALAVAATILIIALMSLLFMAFREDANADTVESGELLPEETIEPAEDEDNWFTQNWKTIVEIFTGSTAIAVVCAILKLIGKVARLRKDLGTTNTDNRALKGAFNEMADNIESLEKQITDLQSQNAIMLSVVQDSEKKSAAVLTILDRLINSSDLPTETKIAYQGVINKANEKEMNANDEE